MLGCGAHVIYLRRVQVANYPYERMVTLEQLAALRESSRCSLSHCSTLYCCQWIRQSFIFQL